MGTIKTTNIETITGSGTLTLGQSGETITIPSGVTITNNGTQTGFGGDNTPAFYAYQSSNQTISTATNTTVTLDTELYDTANAFASNTFTVPSGQGGKYYMSLSARKNNFSSNRFYVYLEDSGGSGILHAENGNGGAYDTANTSGVVVLSAGDTVVMKVYHNQGSNQTILSGKHQTFFQGFKLIGV